MTTTKPITTHSTKPDALREARRRRALGELVLVRHHEGVYTIPFKGLAPYSYFTVTTL